MTQFTILTAGDPDAAEALMRRCGWVADGERIVSCDKAGEGNMNLTLRIVTDRRSVILKQSRPWVEKYPQVPAPVERVVFEHRFYEVAAAMPDVARRMPAILGFSEPDHALLLEDLGEASDFTSMYAGEKIGDDDLRDVAAWLRALHEMPGNNGGFANRAMRTLNHEHIFRFPLATDNGLNLDAHEPGLAAAAATLQADDDYRTRVERTGERYLADGPCLVHGDCFPGSWLRTGRGVAIIDPEFCFPGDREFDVAVTVAHLALARQPERIESFIETYGDDALAPAVLARFAAAEVMRRLIGVAQLPIPRTDGWRADLLERSRQAMLTDSLEPICHV